MTDTVLNSILADKKSSILKKWFDAVIEGPASGTSGHFRIKGDAFANPTGNTVSTGMEGILDGLFSGAGGEVFSELLGNIVRIRAVQDLHPSQALSFIFSLKRIIREELRAEIADQHLSKEILSLESDIDRLALSAFDIFMECREKIYEIKANEARRANFRLLRMAERIDSVNGCRPAPKGNNLTIKEER